MRCGPYFRQPKGRFLFPFCPPLVSVDAKRRLVVSGRTCCRGPQVPGGSASRSRLTSASRDRRGRTTRRGAVRRPEASSNASLSRPCSSSMAVRETSASLAKSLPVRSASICPPVSRLTLPGCPVAFPTRPALGCPVGPRRDDQGKVLASRRRSPCVARSFSSSQTNTSPAWPQSSTTRLIRRRQVTGC